MALVSSAASPGLGAPGPELGAGARDVPECVAVSTEVRYRNYGYDHIVVLRNDCERPQLCDVRSEVSSETTRVSVPVGQTVRVVTYIGSPAREFSASVRCSAEPPQTLSPARAPSTPPMITRFPARS